MTRSLRYLACALLAVMLPIQASAAACAQICMAMQQSEVPQHEEASGSSNHCQQPEKDNAKSCCQAHTFAVNVGVHVIRDAPSSLEHTEFVARWTSFIPEEPSPPPIAAFLFA